LPEVNRRLVIRLLAILLARRAADRASAAPVMALVRVDGGDRDDDPAVGGRVGQGGIASS
jgi:hypothetical protein